MRLRRHSEPPGPSGPAEAELFTFWEHDLTGATAPPPPSGSSQGPTPSTAPLCGAAAVALLVVLVALLV